MIFYDYRKRDSKLQELICDGGYANSFRKDDFTSHIPSYS